MLQAPIKQYQTRQYFSFCARSSSAVALGSAGASFILIKSIAKIGSEDERAMQKMQVTSES